MDNRDALKSMLNNLINDKHEEATLDLHNYFTSKMKDVAGINTQTTEEPEIETVGGDDLETE